MGNASGQLYFPAHIFGRRNEKIVFSTGFSDRLAVEYAKKWLFSIGEQDAKITTDECHFCHSESVPDEIEIEIMTNGFYIQKLEGCPT
ncbi:MAG: DUF2024 family protein [Parcubacteria group bacterium]|nr:DUF2024 family protein [Parcubacteria group bacterium]